MANINNSKSNLLEKNLHDVEAIQKATFNILEDFYFEKKIFDETRRATFNILTDYVGEKNKLNDLQRATFNILEDLNSEKDRLNFEIIERRRAESELTNANKELEAFSYSVSHDLRAPLRSIDGFSKMLLTNYFETLDELGKDYLNRVRTAAQKMGKLIDALLSLSRVSRTQIKREAVDFSFEVKRILEDLKQSGPDRLVNIIVANGVTAQADLELSRILLQNLLSNAWKFTAKKKNPTIEFGVRIEQGRTVYFVRDTGAGFDMSYVNKLFGAFQRLHSDSEFEGTGIGLVTVQRIVHRLGGEVWAQAKLDDGATFFFTLKIEAKK